MKCESDPNYFVAGATQFRRCKRCGKSWPQSVDAPDACPRGYLSDEEVKARYNTQIALNTRGDAEIDRQKKDDQRFLDKAAIVAMQGFIIISEEDPDWNKLGQASYNAAESLLADRRKRMK